MTCAPLSLWRAEESGFSKSESGSDDHGETFVVALSDSTFIEAVLLSGALICARILFVETLAANNAMPSRPFLQPSCCQHHRCSIGDAIRNIPQMGDP